jgi:hypothetical protein
MSLTVQQLPRQSPGYGRPQSKICLPIFLDIVEFLLKLKEALNDQSVTALANQCITDLIEDLADTDNKRVATLDNVVPDISLRNVIAQSGWDERIIRCTLSFMLENTLVIVGYTITRLHASKKSDFTRRCLVDFTTKFSSGFKAYGSLEWLTKTRSNDKKS